MRRSTTMLLIIMLLTSMSLFAQRYTMSGTVKDASTGEALIGASVTIPALQTGAMAGSDGSYKIENLPSGTYEFSVTYIGYNKLVKNIKIAGNLTMNFTLENSGILLEETVVQGTRAKLRETPVAFSEVSGKDIEAQLASRDLPMVLATTPSVYPSLQGGGAGDANMVVRGFDQKNIAVMINGVPVNDMEGKTVYWSNWAGLGDVTDNAQVLRGLGYTPYSVASVGGVINVTTKGIGSIENMYKFRAEMGSWGLRKTQITFSQKIGKFGVVGLLSRKTQEGYIRQTYLDEWTYYFAVGGLFGDHSLELQFVGSPQEHGQRSTSRPISDWDKYGKDWNPNAGRLNDGWYVDAINKYHKPAFNLNWNWQISKSTNLSTVAYYSPGRGWGTSVLGTTPSIIATGDYMGYRDYDKVFLNNRKTDATYSTVAYGTAGQYRTVTGNYVRWNSHDWYGVVSTLKTVLSPSMSLSFGIDGRYYVGMHYGEVRDLIGGDYYVDKYVNGTGGDINNPVHIARIGDVVAYNYEGHVRNLGGFAQMEYKTSTLSAFVNLSAATVGDQRVDFFNYKPDDPMRTTPWVNFFAYTLKTGANYNFDENHSLYANIGYFETPPTLSSIFVGFNSNLANTQQKNCTTEKVLGLELGYQYATPSLVVKLNGFYTKWKDRAFTSSVTDPATSLLVTANLQGSEQLHQGVELEAAYKIFRGLDFRTSASLFTAKYQNDVYGVIASENGSVLKTVNSYVEGLYVPNTPMQIVTASLNYSMNLGYGINVYVSPEYRFYGKNYSSFSADARSTLINGVPDRAMSWQIPDYFLLDLHMGANIYFTDFMIKNANLAFHVFNVLDNRDYLQYASDGSDHSREKAYVYFGRPINYNFSMSVGF